MTRSTLLWAVTLAALATGAVALAPLGGGDFDLSWHTIDGGGETSTGRGFELSGTIGQHDADPTTMTGGPFTLIGGFWPGVGSAPGMPCPWDLEGDGTVGAIDLLILLVNWGPCADCNACPADFDGNCTVGASDLLTLLVNWGACP